MGHKRRDIAGQNALHFVTLRQQDHNINYNVKGSTGRSPFSSVVENRYRREQILSLFDQGHVGIDLQFQAPLRYAARAGNSDVVGLLLEQENIDI
jgi:ankyrin repeat protein